MSFTTDTLPPLPLPDGVKSNYIDCTDSCGLRFHVLTAGDARNPLVLFCHGYPELAYSWRKILPKIAAEGYFCVAMDQRGYGRTTGWDNRGYHDVDLGEFTVTNLIRDLVCLVYGLGYTEVKCIIGHDFGAAASAMAAMMRPDVFRSTVQMSHPHSAPPRPRASGQKPTPKVNIQEELAKLTPPRKHYKWYNSAPEAAHDWDNPPQGLEVFLRGYFHLKSADWAQNKPHAIKEWSASALEVMPEYYIMRKDLTMSETVAKGMEGEDATRTEAWLPQEDLKIYVQEWKRTGFQGALNWYRAQTASTPQTAKDLLLFAGRRIEVPCAFISGEQDWGNYQQPGSLESYRDPKVVEQTSFLGVTFVKNAGHWIQQEQPEKLVQQLLYVLAK